MGFTAFVLRHLPPPPARVVEVGCGELGGVVPALLAARYEALGVDPRAPAGKHFQQVDFRELVSEGPPRSAQHFVGKGGTFDAAVAGRVLHHLHPLDSSLDALASMAPLLVVDEFAWDLIDRDLQDWYEAKRRSLPNAAGPSSLDDWRVMHHDLHRHDVLLAALRARYEERALEWVPYFPRWLKADVESPDRIGYRWAGLRRRLPAPPSGGAGSPRVRPR